MIAKLKGVKLPQISSRSLNSKHELPLEQAHPNALLTESRGTMEKGQRRERERGPFVQTVSESMTCDSQSSATPDETGDIFSHDNPYAISSPDAESMNDSIPIITTVRELDVRIPDIRQEEIVVLMKSQRFKLVYDLLNRK